MLGKNMSLFLSVRQYMKKIPWREQRPNHTKFPLVFKQWFRTDLSVVKVSKIYSEGKSMIATNTLLCVIYVIM